MRFDIPYREPDRLAALKRFAILDTPPEEAFDRVTRLACRLFDAPICTVTLIDAHRQWFKARQGMDKCEIAREPALCGTAIRGRTPLVISDMAVDPRFDRNPIVVSGQRQRFYAGMALRTVDDHAIGTFCVLDSRPRVFNTDDLAAMTEFAGIVMSELELRRLVMTDALTGTLSRRAFFEAARSHLAQAKRNADALSCVMLDLDHFKAINDRHGHPVGDRVLAAAAEACRRTLREGELLGRMGGEEFGVLIPHTGLDEAIHRAEALRTALMQVRVATPAGPLGVTASFGVSSLDASTTDVDALLQRADAALYAAKRGGRNRCATQIQDEICDAGIRSGTAGATSKTSSLAFVSRPAARESTVRAG